MRTLLTLAAAVSAIALTAAAFAADPETAIDKPAAMTAADTPATTTALPSTAVTGKLGQIKPSGPPIVLQANTGTLIRLPGPANTVFVANPAIADVQTVKSPSLIYLTAKTPGETALYAVDNNDHVLLNSLVRVDPNMAPMQQAVELLRDQQKASLGQFRNAGFGENVRVNWMDKTLVLSGTVATLREAEAVRAAATAIAGSVPGSSVLDRLAIATPGQVNIRVKFAEVDRTVTKALGIDLTKLTGAGFTFNPALPLNASGALVTSRLTGLSHPPIQVVLDALAQEGYVKTLAEPNLTVANNETAIFNAGGVFFPTINNPGGIGNALGPPQNFGTTLSVTPTIIDAAHIKLQINPNVSNQPTAAAGGILETATFAKTTVELGTGETFALAGLMQDKSSENVQKVPGLGDIPWIGQLFRSGGFTKTETELVILVTPYLVEPSRTALAAPTDGLNWPHDVQQVISGAMYRQTLPGPAKGPMSSGGQGVVGPVGFRLD